MNGRRSVSRAFGSIADSIAVLHAGALSRPVRTAATSRAALGLLMGGAGEPEPPTGETPVAPAARVVAPVS